MTTLLIADDEQTFLDLMVRLLQRDHKLLIARNWNEVLEKFESNLWRLNGTILDVNMPGLSVDPFSMVEKIIKSNPTVPVVVISGEDLVLRHEFLKMGVFQYLGKPIDMMDLKLAIKGAIAYNRTLRKLENFERTSRDDMRFYKRLYNFDPEDLKDRVETYDTMNFKVPLLFRTEIGTRPNMLARIISREIDGKLFFEKICHENLKNIIPYNIQRDDVLFLDGIENLGKDEHAYLLDVVEELESPTGAKVNNLPKFRLVVSVSSRNNESSNGNAGFAQLLEKLSKVEYRIEPLRLRKHELRTIISLVFERKKKELFSRAEAISDELYDILVEYDWPLNYDELMIMMETLLLTCQDTTLLPKHLHQLDFSDVASSKYPTLDAMVEEHIKKALRMTMGNKSRAAKMLGITPKTLYARIRH